MKHTTKNTKTEQEQSNIAGVIKIATRNRRWAEAVVWYHKIQKIHCYSSSLCGMCAIASLRLFQELKSAGHCCSIAIGDGHVFVIYKPNGVHPRDFLIIDITATQFGSFDDVFVVTLQTGQETYPWYDDCLEFDNEDDFLTELDFPTDYHPSFFDYDKYEQAIFHN